MQDIDRANRKCSVGMRIAKISNRTKGYGQQALQLILEYGFHYLGLERIVANTLDVNTGARKCLEKCKFVLEGTERKSVYFNGRKYDRYCYSLLRQEFGS